jgi:predicted nucleotidyltransferase
MAKANPHDILFSTNSQKVLDFFLRHPGEEFLEREISAAVKISKSGTNYALRALADAGLIDRREKGKVFFCALNHKGPVVKQAKVLQAIMALNGLIEGLRNMASKVILFGSASRGEDIAESDIDLFIVTNNSPESINKICRAVRMDRKLQLVIRTETGYAELQQKDPFFYAQIEKGIVLWEKE